MVKTSVEKKNSPRKAALKKSNNNSAMKLVDIVLNGCLETMKKRNFGLNRLNHSMSDAVNLAIQSGLYFNKGAFITLEKDYNLDHWGGTDRHMLGERLYASAVQNGNMSACQSFEAWKDRKPFIYKGKRIYVGREFEWRGRDVTCTSFAKDGSYLVACAYQIKAWPGGKTTDKVDCRYFIKPEDLRKKKKAD